MASVLGIMGLEKAKGAPTPASAGSARGNCEEEILGASHVKKYRTVIGKLLYVSRRRPGVQFDVTELARHGGKPTGRAWARLKMLCKYLIASQALAQWIETHADLGKVECYADANWGTLLAM